MSKVNYKTVQLVERVGVRSDENNAIEKNDLWRRNAKGVFLSLSILVDSAIYNFIGIRVEKKGAINMSITAMRHLVEGRPFIMSGMVWSANKRLMWCIGMLIPWILHTVV